MIQATWVALLLTLSLTAQATSEPGDPAPLLLRPSVGEQAAELLKQGGSRFSDTIAQARQQLESKDLKLPELYYFALEQYYNHSTSAVLAEADPELKKVLAEWTRKSFAILSQFIHALPLSQEVRQDIFQISLISAPMAQAEAMAREAYGNLIEPFHQVLEPYDQAFIEKLKTSLLKQAVQQAEVRGEWIRNLPYWAFPLVTVAVSAVLLPDNPVANYLWQFPLSVFLGWAGVGTVIAFASDLGPHWATSRWTQQAYQKLWSQYVNQEQSKNALYTTALKRTLVHCSATFAPRNKGLFANRRDRL